MAAISGISHDVALLERPGTIFFSNKNRFRLSEAEPNPYEEAGMSNASENLPRRDFIKSAAILSALAVGGSTFASCASPTVQTSPTPSPKPLPPVRDTVSATSLAQRLGQWEQLESQMTRILQTGPFKSLSGQVRSRVATRVSRVMQLWPARHRRARRSKWSERSLATETARQKPRAGSDKLITSALGLPIEAKQAIEAVFIQPSALPLGETPIFPAGPLTKALVLSGGGSRGSFQVGVLRYMMPHWNDYGFSVVCGTSVGAINALAVAADGQNGVAKMVTAWRSLRFNESMYVPSTQYKQVDDILKDEFDTSIKEVLEGGGGPFEFQIDATTKNAAIILTPVILTALPLIIGMAVMALALNFIEDEVEKKAKKAKKIGELLKAAPSIYSLSPLDKLLRDSVNFGGLWSHRLRLCTVRLQDGVPCYITEAGKLLIGSASESSAALQDEWTLQGTISHPAVLSGALASAAVPAMFPAVQLRESAYNAAHFVDGGVREMFPLHGAQELGVSEILSIGCSPLELTEWNLTAAVPAAAVATPRSLDIVLNEVVRTDMAEMDRHPEISTKLIVPFQNVHDSFLVNQALIRANMEYGYMLAHLHFKGEELGLANTFLAWITIETITELRHEVIADEIEVAVISRPRLQAELVDLAEEIFELITKENVKFEVPFKLGFKPDLLNRIRENKRKIRDLTETLFALLGESTEGLPIAFDANASIHDWWQEWEMKQYPLGYRLGGGNEPTLDFPGTSTPIELLKPKFGDINLWSRLPIVTSTGAVTKEGSAPSKPVIDVF